MTIWAKRLNETRALVTEALVTEQIKAIAGILDNLESEVKREPIFELTLTKEIK